MDALLQQFKHLRIPLEEIRSATNEFNDEKNYIGGGGFGKVYKGEVSHSEGRSVVAIKRLDPRHGQGAPEFLKEITMLSNYKHQNLISLLGFCYQGDEMILVYEHASRGSLDRHLKSLDLTWTRRLKICLDAAKGLSYLHDPRGTHQRLIHCDLKSANILLDSQWNAKVSDFGLAIMGPANGQHSLVVTIAAGTLGYCDPQYAMTHTLTKESDVYSLGVVLFEVLCGNLCCTYSNGHLQQKLVPMWIESYKQKQLKDIIFKDPTIQPLDQSSLETFSDIAYRCLNESRKDRPKMAEVVAALETALESQEFSEWELLFDYVQMTRTIEPPLNYRSKHELRKLLSKGVLVNGGNTWFSLNKKGEHYVMTSFVECLVSDPSKFDLYSCSKFDSRFPVGAYNYKNNRVIIHVKTKLLSPLITYTVNLVFKFRISNDKTQDYMSLRYKLEGEAKTSISYLAYNRKDGWWTCELYQFTSDQRTVDLKILLEGCDDPFTELEGIEFLPLEKVEHKIDKLDMQPKSDSEANWENKLPTDYKHIMKWSKNSMQWTTKKEAYSFMCKGFLINDGQQWFSLDKNGKKCHMTSARALLQESENFYLCWMSLSESRFREAVSTQSCCLSIKSKIQSQLLSGKTTYATYLVYKLPNDKSEFEAPLQVSKEYCSKNSWYIYLVSPQTPIIRPKADQNTHNRPTKLIKKGLPQERTDGWMEVQIWEFKTHIITEMIPMYIYLRPCGVRNPSGLIIEGVEHRPI